MNRAVFTRDWKAAKRPPGYWFSRTMEALCVAVAVVMMALSW